MKKSKKAVYARLDRCRYCNKPIEHTGDDFWEHVHNRSLSCKEEDDFPIFGASPRTKQQVIYEFYQAVTSPDAPVGNGSGEV